MAMKTSVRRMRGYIDEFCIGIHPVTNAEYARFVRRHGHPSPAIGEIPLIASGKLEGDFRTLAAAYCWNNGTFPAGRDLHPVTLVRSKMQPRTASGWRARPPSPYVFRPKQSGSARRAAGLTAMRFPWATR